MGASGNSLLYLFLGVAAVTLVWRIVRDRDWKNFLPDNFKTSWKFLSVVSLVIALIFFGLNAISAGVLIGAVYFIGSFLLAFALSELNLAPFSRSILLLLVAVGLSVSLPNVVTHEHWLLAISCMLGGLSVWKLSSNILRPASATLLDYLPSLVWLVSSLWCSVANLGDAGSAKNLGMVLAVLTVSVFLRWVQMPLLWEDPVYLKRIVLSISGGLMVLIIANKLLLAITFAQLAGAAGVGFLASFLLDSLDNNKSEASIQDALTKLALVGGLTLLAGRLYGSEALLVLAAAAVIVARSGLAQTAAMFWALRVLQQSYTDQFNSNVTGININHEYVGAALYFGLAGAAIVSVALRNYKSGSLLAGLVPLTAFAAAAGSSYLIHAEPTASLIVGGLVGSTIFALAGKEIFGDDFAHYQSVLLCSAVLTAFGLILSPLLELGNTATSHDRLVAVGGLSLLFLVGSLVSFFMGGGFRKKPVADAEATPTPTPTPTAPAS